MNLQRITATDYSINWVVSKKDEVPTVQKCQLGPTSEAQANDPSNLQALISSAVQNQTCPEGIYHANGLIFMAKNGIVTQYSAATGSMPPAISTPGK
jgi:hypothetical protein